MGCKVAQQVVVMYLCQSSPKNLALIKTETFFFFWQVSLLMLLLDQTKFWPAKMTLSTTASPSARLNSCWAVCTQVLVQMLNYSVEAV